MTAIIKKRKEYSISYFIGLTMLSKELSGERCHNLAVNE
jgi:hypothetical protein